MWTQKEMHPQAVQADSADGRNKVKEITQNLSSQSSYLRYAILRSPHLAFQIIKKKVPWKKTKESFTTGRHKKAGIHQYAC